MAEVTLEFLQESMLRVLNKQAETRREQTTIRRENGEMRTLALLLSDQGRRIERKLGEVRDEIEPMVKSKLMGRLGRFGTQIEARLDALTPHPA